MTISPFVEAPKVYTTISSSMSNSLNTTDVDPFRQGVELTLDPYFYDGLVKIWSGEKNHQLPQRQFGEIQEEIFPESTLFTEIDYFNPVLFVKQQTLTGNMPSLTYPVVFQSSILRPGNVLDGIVEPLAIRHVAQFTSIDAPFEPHAIHGNLESGNFNQFVNSDKIISKVQFSQETKGIAPYEDNVDLANGTPINVGFFPNNSKIISPFHDEQYKSGVILDSYESGLIVSASLAMSCSTENYCAPGYKIYTSGYTWKTATGIGADSLAYGNLAFKPKRTPSLR